MTGNEGALILEPALDGNKKIKDFIVDVTIDIEIFEKINRKTGGGKEGKKKKKGKK